MYFLYHKEFESIDTSLCSLADFLRVIISRDSLANANICTQQTKIDKVLKFGKVSLNLKSAGCRLRLRKFHGLEQSRGSIRRRSIKSLHSSESFN